MNIMGNKLDLYILKSMDPEVVKAAGVDIDKLEKSHMGDLLTEPEKEQSDEDEMEDVEEFDVTVLDKKDK